MVATSFLAGFVVDRLGPTRILPVILLPLGVAIAVLSLPGGVSIWFLVLAGAALTNGMMVTGRGNALADALRHRWIGGVKALATSFLVLSTAIGPGVTGALIDLGITFPQQALASPPGVSAWCAVFPPWCPPRLSGASRAPTPQAA